MTGVLFLFLSAGSGPLQENPEQVYERVRPSVVAIRSLAVLGERSGTGVVIDRDGLILTSYSVVPRGAKNIRVWTTGPGLHRDVEIVGTSRKHEISLLRIRPKKPLVPIRFGKSGRIRIGDTAYTAGNAANSIILDNQLSFQVGVISAIYTLEEPRANSTYRGVVLETSAAVNIGMEGSPLLDRRGRMIGFVTLNYSPNRFLGCAIPIDDQLFVLERLKEKGKPDPDPAPSEGVLGISVRAKDGGLVVDKVVPGSSAEHAGLMPGDILESIGKTPLRKPEDLQEALKGMKSGDVIWISLRDIGEIKIELRGKR